MNYCDIKMIKALLRVDGPTNDDWRELIYD